MSISNLKKYDQADMLGSIQLIPKQAQAAWQQASKLKLPADYRQINQIIVIGMGGSILGPELVKNILNFKLAKPLNLVSDYVPDKLSPAQLENTLFILSSYSGNTEEVLDWTKLFSSVSAAKRPPALKILGITAGGRLETWLKKNKKPYYKINTEFNPCGQPRIGTAFSIFALLAFLQNLGLINLNKKNLAAFFQRQHFPWAQAVKNLTKKLKNKLPIIIAAQHLKANAHILANQINENAKTMAAWFTIPELNHHLLEGLQFPASNHRQLIFIFLESGLYSAKTQLRFKLTKQILAKHKLSYTVRQIKQNPQPGPKAEQALSQALEMLIWGAYLSFYLALTYQLNPSEIPVVQEFKKHI